jgi:competence protein ComEA
MKGTESQRDGAVVIVVIVVIFFAILYSWSSLPSQISDIPFGNKSFGPVIVGITGDRVINGIFHVPERARISELLEAARIGDPEIFNHPMLSKRLSTGKTVVIESSDSIRIAEMNNTTKLALGIPIDINKATVEDIMLIDGIGEKTASRIIQFREKSGRYHKVEDLMKIPGIKEKKFRKLRMYFCTDEML